MPRSRRCPEFAQPRRTDEGSASLEFLTVGLLLLVPTVYLVLALASIQGAAFAVEGAARHASRVFVQAGSPDDAHAAASRAIEVTLADYGVDPDGVEVAISCSPDPADCLRRRGFVTVTVTAVAALPVFPTVLGTDLPLGVRIDSTATEQVSRFAGVDQ